MTYHRTVFKSLIDPIRIGFSIPIGIKSTLGKLLVFQEEFLILRSIHYFGYFTQTLWSILKIVCDFTVSFSFLCSNQYYTVTGSSAIDSCRSTILQNFHRLNVIRVNTTNIAGNTSIHYIQRIARAVRTYSTDTHLWRSTRFSRCTEHLHTSSFTLQCLLSTGNGTCFHIFWFYRRYGTGQWTFLLHAITYHHHFIQRFSVFFQYHIHYSCHCFLFLCQVADVGIDNRRSFFHRQRVVAVHIRNDTVGSAFLKDTHANHRFIQVVSNPTVHLYSLGLCQTERKTDQ